jgi:hypothetical protein
MRAAPLFVASVTLFLFGCGGSQSVAENLPFAEKVGQLCTVQLRRGDALGAGQTPVPPTTNAMNGAEVMVSGLLTAVTGRWIAIDSGRGNEEYWIPRESILLIQFAKAGPPHKK